MALPLLTRKLHTHGLVRFDTRYFPLVFLDLLSGKIQDEDFKQAFVHLEAVLRTGERSFQVTDLSLVTDAPPSQRKIAGDWTERTAELQRAYSLGGAVVAPSAVLRGILTAVHWFKKPPSPTKVVSSRSEAILHAISVLEGNGIPVNDEMRALAMRSQLSATGAHST
jgi:hypothetical protein